MALRDLVTFAHRYIVRPGELRDTPHALLPPPPPRGFDEVEPHPELGDEPAAPRAEFPDWLRNPENDIIPLDGVGNFELVDETPGGWRDGARGLSGADLSRGQAMRFKYHHETGSLSIELADRPSADSLAIGPGVVLDFDAEGRLVGSDVEHASQVADLTRLQAESLPVRWVDLARG